MASRRFTHTRQVGMVLKLAVFLLATTPAFSLIGPMTKQNGDVDLVSVINHVTLMEQVVLGMENTMKAASTEMTIVKADLKTTREEFLSLQSEHNTAIKDLAVTEQQLKDALKDIVTLQSDLKSAQSEVASLQSKIAGPSELTDIKSDISQLKKDVIEVGHNLNATQTDLSSTISDVHMLQSRQINSTIIDMIGADVKENSKQITSLQTEQQQIRSELNRTSPDVKGHGCMCNVTRQDVSSLNVSLSDLTTALKDARFDVDNIGNQQNVIREEIRSLARQMSSFSLDLNTTQQELTDVDLSTNSLLTLVNELNVSVSNLSVIVEHLETDIAFQASPSAYFFDAKDGDKLTFDSVHSNVGNGYNATSSEFVAPVSGTYIFWAGASTFGPNTHVKIRLNINHDRNGYLAQGTGIASNNATQSTATVLTVVHLQPGDVIWVGKYEGTDRLFGSEESYLGGVLLHRH